MRCRNQKAINSPSFAKPSSFVRLTPDYGGQDGAAGCNRSQRAQKEDGEQIDSQKDTKAYPTKIFLQKETKVTKGE
jgi:hypothetical protein